MLPTDTLHTIDLATGKPLWTYAHEGHDIQDFLLLGDTLVVSHLQGSLLSGLHLGSGDQKWTIGNDVDGMSPVYRAGDTVLVTGDVRPVDPDSSAVVGNDCRVTCVVAATGEVRWSRVFRECQSSDLTFADHLHLLAGNQLVTVDLRTGRTLWSRDLAISSDVEEQPVNAVPVVSEGAVWIAGSTSAPGDAATPGFDTATGRRAWSVRLPERGALLLDRTPGTALVASQVFKKGLNDLQTLSATDPDRGVTRWKRTKSFAAFDVHDGLIRCAGARAFDLLDLATGQRVHQAASAE